ncbi:zinc finger protein 8-like isoform X1 [Pleurodeles waltl]|uniref:zinc finger protein 8-like isoform X1 n=1 Tax=Pleurodeles waltl TaxID=8319 RepID=UPI00370960D0
MGRRQAPGKKRKVQCSPECVRGALPVLPVLNVSASRAQQNDERDHELEPLSGSPPNVILLSMLEELEAKLDNLQNTLEDVPSRVAGLMEQIWIEKGQYYLQNGGVSLGMVSPVTVRDCSFRRPPPINLSVRARELNQCLQPTSPQGCEPLQSQCLQPTSPHWLEPQQSQCLQPMSLDGNGLQQDSAISTCPPLDVPVIPGEPNLCRAPTFDEEEEPQQDQCTQPQPEELVKKEQLYGDSWGPHQNICLHPPFHEGLEPQQNHCRQPVLPDEKESDERIKQELLCFNGEGPQQTHCRQPAFQEEQSLQHSASLQQVLSDAHEQHQKCKMEPMHPEAQNADQHYKLEPLYPENCYQSYRQVPLHPEDCNKNSNLQPTCTDVQGPLVSCSFLAQNTANTDGAIATEPLERGKSDVLLFKAIPAQQSQKESMNSKEKLKASGGRKNFAHKINERKRQRIHRSEKFNNKILLRHKRIYTGLGAYCCAECKKTFTGKTHLLLHENTDIGLRQYPCIEHETRFADEATLIRLEKTPCNMFEKSFTEKVHLQQHQRKH